jgi:hypothetical protein
MRPVGSLTDLAGHFILLAWISGPLGGQETTSLPDSEVDSNNPGIHVQLKTGGAYFGNFFQTPDGVPGEDVFAGTGQLRLIVPWSGSRSEIHGGVGGSLFDQFDPSLSLFVGGRWERGVHALTTDASVRTHSPRVEVGDSIGFADVILAQASYEVRPKRAIGLRAIAKVDRQVYSRSEERNNHAIQVGGAIRFYGFGYVLSPEVGAETGGRNVDFDEEDYDQRTFWLTCRSVPSPMVYLSLRYRSRSRDYTHDNPTSRNLERKDDRQDLTLTVELSLTEQWGWTGYFSVQDANSTKESREFSTQYLWTGLTYRFN